MQRSEDRYSFYDLTKTCNNVSQFRTPYLLGAVWSVTAFTEYAFLPFALAGEKIIIFSVFLHD